MNGVSITRWLACAIAAGMLGLGAVGSAGAMAYVETCQLDLAANEGDAFEQAEFGAALAVQGDLVFAAARGVQGSAGPAQGVVAVYRRVGDELLPVARIGSPRPFAGENFGHALAVSGDTLLVAGEASVDQRAVHIFHRDDDTTWSLQATLHPPFANADPRYGDSVAVSGDLLLVGSRQLNGSAGRVFIYRRDGTSWVPDGLLQGSVNEPSFGSTVALSGTLALVGAPVERVDAGRNGRVYRFDRGGAGWAPQGTIIPSNTGQLMRVGGYGGAIVIDGDRALVGAPESLLAGGATGGVFVFTLDPASATQDGPPLNDIVESSGDQFGSVLAIYGERVAVGSPGYRNSSALVGKVRFFDRVAGQWQRQTQYLEPSSVQAAQTFGRAIVMIDADHAVIGNPTVDAETGLFDIGEISLHARIADTWQTRDIERLPDGPADDQFGYRVVIDGDWAAVSAPYRENDVAAPTGAVEFYRRDGDAWRHDSRLQPDALAAHDRFGSSLALRDDIVVIGAIGADAGAQNAGEVWIYVRDTAQGWILQQRLISPEPAAGGVFGSAVAFDVQHPDRLVVGAMRELVNGVAAGAAYVYERVGDRWALRVRLTPRDPVDQREFGFSVAASGNRVFVGAPAPRVPTAGYGSLRVFDLFGSAAIEALTLNAYDPAPQDYFGAALAVGRDATGDVAYIGAPGCTNEGRAHAGCVFVARWPGPDTTALTIDALSSPPSLRANDAWGNALAWRDGDVLVGAPATDAFVPGQDKPLLAAGLAYLYPHGDTAAMQIVAPSGPMEGAWAGLSVALDGGRDGLPRTVMLGAPRRSTDRSAFHGAVHVFEVQPLLSDGFEGD